MSGIAGVIGISTDEFICQKMLKTMEKRGPDGNGVWSEGDCCLLYARLSAAERDEGMLPMGIRWGDEDFTIVFNGNIYNGDEIRSELLRNGHVFQTNSDSETVLRAYVQWKEVALDKLNGVFSFGIWHHRDRKLFLARDRIGVKPLFYYVGQWGICFATEIKTLLAHPKIPSQINADGVAQVFLLGPGRKPGSGVFKDIYELKPGFYGVYDGGKWAVKRYWKLKDREHIAGFRDTAEYVRYLVLDAIDRQTPDDTNVGAFLSGGLDSSIISSICSKRFKKIGKKLRTFSVDYQDHEKYFISNKFQPESDRHYIDLMCNEIESKHTDIILSAEDLANCLDAATIARDLPGMGDVDFSLMAFTGRVAESVSVAFSGECADEIFGGYPWYRDPDIRSAEGFPWAQNVYYRAGFVLPEYLKEIEPNAYVMELYKTTVNDSDILPGTSRLERRMKELVNLNFEWFMQTLLDRNDRMSMYHGLDVRVPFCDYRIAEYLYGVPWEFKDYGNREKGLLRYAMQGVLPEKVLYRKKSPYPKTFDPKYLELVSQKLRDVAGNPESPILQLVRRDSLEKLLTAEFTWPWYGQLMRLPQTIAFMLQVNRWMELYHITIV